MLNFLKYKINLDYRDKSRAVIFQIKKINKFYFKLVRLFFESAIIGEYSCGYFSSQKKPIPQTRAVIFLKNDHTDKTRVILEFKLK